MRYVDSLNRIYKNIENSFYQDGGQNNSKLFGIVFCHDASPLARTEILPHIEHFNYRSSKNIDFFFVGYERTQDEKNTVAIVNGKRWCFKEELFSKVIDELEVDADWIFSGETDFLLLNAIKNENKISFDYESAIVCNLEQMAKDQAFSSVRAFFTDIFNYAKTSKISINTNGFSNREGIKIGKETLKTAILSVLPPILQATYQKANHYAVRHITQKPNKA